MSGARIDPSTRDLVLTTATDLARPSSPVEASMQTRLATRRGTCFWDVTFGSDLGNLVGTAPRGAVDQVENAARAALQPMVAQRDITNLSVTAQAAGQGRVDVTVTAQDGRRRPITWRTFVRVA